jgi:pyrroline-5-carboxylate reductase
MADRQLGIIGGGNMAEAIVRGVLRSGLLSTGQIVVSEPRADRREVLSRSLSVACVDDNAQAAGCPRLLLAVKPQIMADVLEGIAPVVTDQTLVISIAAGVRSTVLDNGLAGRGRLVRVMPNTPMLVGQGISALSAGPRASAADVAWAQNLFETAGQTVIVSEQMLDAVTAVSGSGPAYFFYLIEAMVDAGTAEGLPEDVAAQLAIHTCGGAARLLVETGESPADLRRKVTSPGGTTEAAIASLDAAGAQAALARAVHAAADRSRELGK